MYKDHTVSAIKRSVSKYLRRGRSLLFSPSPCTRLQWETRVTYFCIDIMRIIWFPKSNNLYLVHIIHCRHTIHIQLGYYLVFAWVKKSVYQYNVCIVYAFFGPYRKYYDYVWAYVTYSRRGRYLYIAWKRIIELLHETRHKVEKIEPNGREILRIPVYRKKRVKSVLLNPLCRKKDRRLCCRRCVSIYLILHVYNIMHVIRVCTAAPTLF